MPQLPALNHVERTGEQGNETQVANQLCLVFDFPQEKGDFATHMS